MQMLLKFDDFFGKKKIQITTEEKFVKVYLFTFLLSNADLLPI